LQGTSRPATREFPSIWTSFALSFPSHSLSSHVEEAPQDILDFLTGRNRPFR
jgi:hypothetical protein